MYVVICTRSQQRAEEGDNPSGIVLLPFTGSSASGDNMRIRIPKHKNKKILKAPKDLSHVKFLDNVVDDCDINGDFIANEYVFYLGVMSWNPKVIEV